MATFITERTDEQKQIDAVVLERVQRGIALLKEKHGDGWVEKIDLRELKLHKGAYCVLGQVYGNYEPGCRDLGLEPFRQDAIDCGFLIPTWETNRRGPDGWEELQQAWEQELAPLIDQHLHGSDNE